MHILIFEPRLSGHRAPYLKFVIQAAQQIAESITLITSSQCESLPEYQDNVSALAASITVLPIEDSTHLSGLKQDFYRFNLLRKQIAVLQPDAVWIPFVDRLVQVVGLMQFLNLPLVPKHLKIPVVGMMFRGAYVYKSDTNTGSLKDKLSMKLAAVAPLHALYTVDNVLQDYLVKHGCAHARLMPEAVEETNLPAGLDLRARLHLPSHAKARFIVSLGPQNRRKGVDLLIRAFLLSDTGPEDYLVLAGKMDADIAAVLAENSGHAKYANMIVRNERLSLEDMQCFLEVADYIAATYPNHIGSSSFVIRAAASRKPLIAADNGWIGLTVRQYKLGFTCKVSDLSQFSGLISRIMSTSEPIQLPDSDFDTLVKFHTVDNFKRTWAESLMVVNPIK